MENRARLIRGLIAATVIGAVCAQSAAGTSRRLPAPVTLSGVGGVRIGMTSTQVVRLVGGQRLVVGNGSSSAWTYIPICAGSMHGAATFFGPDSNLRKPGADTLESIWFSAGAKTRRGVGIGSSRSQVVRIYGSQLHHDYRDLFLSGRPVEIFQGTYVRPVIYFSFDRDKVSELAYGGRQWLVGGAGASIAAAFC